MKTIRLSVSEFALPSPRTGSIESQSGLSNAMEVGLELHREIQESRQQEYAEYKPEVRISHEFERDGFRFIIDGRMDGIFEGDEPLIEEIKSSFNIYDLSKSVKEKGHSHPYVLQLLTYGYFYYLNHEKMPHLALHLVSSRNRDTMDVPLTLHLRLFEEWLNRRLDELVMMAKRSEKRSRRRKDMAKEFLFPFAKPRSGQVELIETVERGMIERKHLMLQAPTGLGKTVGVLYPALKEALSRGEKVLYVTPKNSQQSVAEEAVAKFQEQGTAVKSLTLTAKSKLCMKAEPLCNPDYCEFAKDYYDKIEKHGLRDQMGKKKKISARMLKNLAEKYEVCPFELQLEAIEEFDTIICDYNYVFSDRSVLGRLPRIVQEDMGKPNLVIDEAHNLPSRAMSYYSPALSTSALEVMREELKSLPKKFAADGVSLLNECQQIIRDQAVSSPPKSERIDISVLPFADQDEHLRNFLSRYLDSDIEIRAKDVVLRLVFYWSEFTEVLRKVIEAPGQEFFISFIPGEFGGSIKITCCDASEMIKPKYEFYENVVAFSATLKPFNYYAELSGLDSPKLELHEFSSPFDVHRRKILVIPQVSTKYSERERNYAKISEAIERITQLKSGNYIAFFPSFDFLERVLQLLRAPKGMRVIKQNRYMKNDDVESILDGLRSLEQPTLLMAVQGGVFSEGVDYPGDMVIGAFVVGPPLPNFDFERESIKAYYQEKYQKGFDYAYTYPAMAKAVQSAGRVIRSEQDKGVIILMDDRFLQKQYAQSMPGDWFDKDPRELTSQSILKDLEEFWK
jgi:DNA excision repair protein ERCC-2